MLYKDACNSKSNQQNLGTIKCSNLCTEIIEYTAPDEVAVCNLASIALPGFVVNKVHYHLFRHQLFLFSLPLTLQDSRQSLKLQREI